MGTLHKFHAGRFNFDGEIDSQKGIIPGVSLMTIGEAKGHGMQVDMTTLMQVMECCKEFNNGVRVNADHYSGILSCVGLAKNFRIDGQQLKADLVLCDADENEMGKIIWMAQNIPDTWGFSMSFSGVDQQIGTLVYARCDGIFSADLVTDPAANEAGVFADRTLETQELTHVISKNLFPLTFAIYQTSNAKS